MGDAVKSTDVTQVPALGMSYQFAVGDKGMTLVFQSHVESSASLTTINALLDKIAAAALRQSKLVELADLDEKLVFHSHQVLVYGEALNDLDRRAQDKHIDKYKDHSVVPPWDPERMPSVDRQARNNTIQSLERTRSEIRALKKRKDELTKAIFDVSAGATDRYPGVPNSAYAGND